METKQRKHKGNAFYSKQYAKWFLQRCFECGLENHGMVVATGTCAWCGFDEHQKREEANVHS